MQIARLSKKALLKLISGDVAEDGICVIKFYSNGCHLCHALRDTYAEVAGDYEDLHFFAFNVQDDPKISKVLKFDGVPNISMFKIKKGKKTQVKKITEPEEPHKTTWYTAQDIRNFIEKER